MYPRAFSTKTITPAQWGWQSPHENLFVPGMMGRDWWQSKKTMGNRNAEASPTAQITWIAEMTPMRPGHMTFAGWPSQSGRRLKMVDFEWYSGTASWSAKQWEANMIKWQWCRYHKSTPWRNILMTLKFSDPSSDLVIRFVWYPTRTGPQIFLLFFYGSQDVQRRGPFRTFIYAGGSCGRDRVPTIEESQGSGSQGSDGMVALVHNLITTIYIYIYGYGIWMDMGGSVNGGTPSSLDGLFHIFHGKAQSTNGWWTGVPPF